ncbi:MAG: hypothetical protein ACSHX0_10055 [Akkermansiaceae bacterium]
MKVTAGCLAFLLMISSCINQKISKRLADHDLSQREAISSMESHVFSKNTKSIDWATSLKLINTQNTQLIASRKSLEKAKRAQQKLWYGLIPRVFLYANISSSISELVSLSNEDVNSGAYANLQIPSPFTLYANLYSAGLGEVQAGYTYELNRRNIQVSLYALFQQRKAISLKEKDIYAKEKDLENIPTVELWPALKKVKLLRKALVVEKERHRVRVNALLNTPKANWELVGEPPRVSYANKFQKLNFEDGFGVLGLKLQAVQIESALISLKAAKLRQLPRVSFNLSAPSIFNTENDEEIQFDPENFQIFSGLNKSVELVDVWDKENIQDAEFRYQISKEQLLIRMERETSQLAINKKTYRDLLIERDYIKTLVRDYDELKEVVHHAAVINDVKEYNNLKNQLDRLDQQILQFDLQFWIWDENYWANN